MFPLRAFLRLGGGSGFASGLIGVAAHTAPARHRGASRYRRGISLAGLSASWGRLKVPFRVPGARLTAAHARYPPIAVPGPARRGVPAGPSFVRALRACSVLRCMRSVQSALVLPMAFSVR